MHFNFLFFKSEMHKLVQKKNRITNTHTSNTHKDYFLILFKNESKKRSINQLNLEFFLKYYYYLQLWKK